MLKSRVLRTRASRSTHTKAMWMLPTYGYACSVMTSPTKKEMLPLCT